MPIDAKPLFRPDVLRPHLADFALPLGTAEYIAKWSDALGSAKADTLNEKELLPDFLTDIFCNVLGYVRVVDSRERYTFSREKHVQVDGKFADAVLGEFTPSGERFVVAVEGKGPKDPLDRAHAGRKMSAVDQGYRYAINLPCDWVIVTSMRQTRLYHKGSNQHTYERFDIQTLAKEPEELKRFVFLLGAERVVPKAGRCHFPDLLAATERVGRDLTKEFYQRYAGMREQAFDHLRVANPDAPAPALLRATQKVLDRVLFCCFAEDRGLLPSQTIHKAYEHKDPYHKRPIWENFRGLFEAVDAGNDDLQIPAYNGGLFAEDRFLNGLKVPDEVCRLFQDLAAYDFRPGHIAAIETEENRGGPLVDVDILGHIFEQSITDLERLHDELEGRTAPVTREEKVTRRKKQGAFYTPPFITRYIVGQALGGVLRDRFEALRQTQAKAAEGTVRKLFTNPRVFSLEALNKPQKAALTFFWSEWQEEMSHIRVLDPACGSGAFLIEAFDQLHVAYQESNDRLEQLRGSRSLFDLDRHILQNNLYGVDLNEEAVEICRLSLWIKTAEKGKPLTSLDASIRAGNSIVSDASVDPRAFDWTTAFPQVVADGGFDVVVGNPPYVRQEWLATIKPHLQSRYKAYDGVADLYVYFYELGLQVLRPGGRMSYVVTNKWLKAGYGEPLRGLLTAESWVESIVDFGHAKQIFPDADVFPCILVTRKPDDTNAPVTSRVCSIPREQLRIEDLVLQIEESGFEVPRGRFGLGTWTLESPAVDDLLEKLRRNGVPLKEFTGVRPLLGIKTGLNEAFLIDATIKNKLVAEDPRLTEILRPYLRGQDIDRWQPDWAGLWMLAIKSSENFPWPWADAGDGAEAMFTAAYPAVYAHLSKFRDGLIKRQDQGRYWWELRSCGYWDRFDKPKLFYQDITWNSQVCFDAGGTLANNTVYFLPSDDLWVLAVLNSPAGWWFSWRKAQHGKDEALRFFTEFVETLPIPRPELAQRDKAESLVRQLLKIADRRHSATRNLLDWLQSEYEVSKPSQKLHEPTRLTEETFLGEVRKARGKSKPIGPAALRALKDGYTEIVLPLKKAADETQKIEQELSDCVNEAYGLTTEEVTLMWKTAPPRMPVRLQ